MSDRLPEISAEQWAQMEAFRKGETTGDVLTLDGEPEPEVILSVRPSGHASADGSDAGGAGSPEDRPGEA